MNKLGFLGVTACVGLALTSCKSSESAYKKAYEKAKQNELAEVKQEPVAKQVETVQVVTPQQEVRTETNTVTNTAPVNVREERVSVVSGSGLKDFSVVCGVFSVQANADNLKNQLANEGYHTMVVLNQDAAPGTPRYRVIVGTYDDRYSAAEARDAFKAKYPHRKDFKGSWLLYRKK